MTRGRLAVKSIPELPTWDKEWSCSSHDSATIFTRYLLCVNCIRIRIPTDCGYQLRQRTAREGPAASHTHCPLMGVGKRRPRAFAFTPWVNSLSVLIRRAPQLHRMLSSPDSSRNDGYCLTDRRWVVQWSIKWLSRIPEVTLRVNVIRRGRQPIRSSWACMARLLPWCTAYYIGLFNPLGSFINLVWNCRASTLIVHNPCKFQQKQVKKTIKYNWKISYK